MKKSKGEDATVELTQSAKVNQDLNESAQRLEVLQAKIQDFVMGIPNIPHESVPVGKDETDNQEIKKWGEVPSFSFPVKDHVDLGGRLGIDFEAAAKLSGSRFVVLRGKIARLHRALAQFMLDTQGK